jgi:hypothetical protein
MVTVINDNKIIIRSVYKITKAIFEPAINPITRRYADCVRSVDSNGDIRLTEEDKKKGRYVIAENESIELHDGFEFDLTLERDAAWWEAIRYSKRIAQDRFERNEKGELVIDGSKTRYGGAEFYVERPGHEAKAKNSKNRAIFDAKAYVYQDTSEGILQKVKLLGQAMIGRPIDEVEQYLIDYADRDPARVADLYTGADTQLRLLLIDAIDKQVITRKDGLYQYGEKIVLGATDNSVIMWFKNPDNKRLFEMLKREVYPEYFPSTTTPEDLGEKPKEKSKPKI